MTCFRQTGYFVIFFVVTALAVLAKTSAAQDLTPTDVAAYKGEQVMLNCSGTRVSWSRTESGTKLFTSPDQWGTTDRSKYDIVDKYHLVIKDLQPNSDGGRYQCDTDESLKLLFADVVVLGNMSVRCHVAYYY